MKKGLLLLFLSVPCLAEGPRYRHLDKTTNLEIQNIYQDIRGARVSSTTLPSGSTQYIQNTTTPQTATYSVSSGTVLTEFNIGAGGTIMKALATGEITQPLQPSFLSTDGTGASNVTGDGTAYTELWPTEIYDQGGDFSSNTFTAPVAGRYLFHANVLLQNILTTHVSKYITLRTSNRDYIHETDLTSVAAPYWALSVGAIADMDAGDTAIIIVTVDGSTKTVDIYNAANANQFSGSLIN